MCTPKLSQHDTILRQKFIHVSCGLDYTMALDQHGKLLAWGSPSMAQVRLSPYIGKSSLDNTKKLWLKYKATNL